ncbi:MAG TPA: glycosyl hydrolase [Longimicrobiales bacterium]|nr:glycosyl hydrolase [Longimicrobiales bacterium]
MKRRYRIMVSAVAALLSVALVITLIMLGTASQGPLRAALDAVGGAISRLEARVARAARGTAREDQMKWLAPYRTSADSLRQPRHILLGAYDDGIPATLDGVMQLEQALAQPLPLIQIYSAWGDQPDQQFPQRLVRAIDELGSIPVITWEPWLTAFENSLHPELPLRDQRDRGGLAGVAVGTYDFYIDRWARAAAQYGRPLLLRFAHEMNDPYRYPWGPQNNEVIDFLNAWRHVVARFRAAGAHNVLWVWSPHVAYAGYEVYYPGNDVVDWIATGALNYGTVAYWSQWWTFQEIFGQRYDVLAALNRPIMIAEFGSLAVGGDRAQWFRQALLNLPSDYPAVKAVLFFHVGRDQTVTYQALDWSFAHDSATVTAVRSALSAW